MSAHTRGPRKRSRKTRSHAPRVSPPSPGSVPAPPLGERPHALWHPLPLSELLILAGAIATAIGFARNFAGTKLLLAGVAAVALGTIEVTLREHRAGFRSHTLLLSVLPVVAMHSSIVLIVSAFTAAPAVLSAGLLLLDVAVFGVLFKLLRASYLNARVRAAARR